MSSSSHLLQVNISGNATFGLVIIRANSTLETAIYVSGQATLTQSTLKLQLGAPLPDGSVIPILKAGSIEGHFSAVVVQDDPASRSSATSPGSNSGPTPPSPCSCPSCCESSSALLTRSHFRHVDNCQDVGSLATWKLILIVVGVALVAVVVVAIGAWYGRRAMARQRMLAIAGLYEADDLSQGMRNPAFNPPARKSQYNHLYAGESASLAEPLL